MLEAAKMLPDELSPHILIKGGHLKETICDLFAYSSEIYLYIYEEKKDRKP